MRDRIRIQSRIQSQSRTRHKHSVWLVCVVGLYAFKVLASELVESFEKVVDSTFDVVKGEGRGDVLGVLDGSAFLARAGRVSRRHRDADRSLGSLGSLRLR